MALQSVDRSERKSYQVSEYDLKSLYRCYFGLTGVQHLVKHLQNGEDDAGSTSDLLQLVINELYERVEQISWKKRKGHTQSLF